MSVGGHIEERQPIETQILAALDQTGFLFEQHVLQGLKNAGFTVEINVPFADMESSKSREIDIVAGLSDFAETSETVGDPWLHFEIIAECKNTANPFVIIGREEGSSSNFCENYYAAEFDPLSLGWRGILDGAREIFDVKRLDGGAFADGYQGNQLVRLTRQSGGWKADNQGVFDSIFYPLAKASLSRMADMRPEEPEDESPSYAFYFPVLITSGPVYRTQLGHGSPIVEEVGWAPLVRRFKGAGLKGEFLIEVVAWNSIDRYLEQRVFAMRDSIVARMRANPNMFNPMRLEQEYGLPTQRKEFEQWKSRYLTSPRGRKQGSAPHGPATAQGR